MANTDFTFDFGFSAVDENELEVLQSTKAELETTTASSKAMEDKINKLYNMVQPLLNNLKANPEKDYIHWPGKLRMSKIEEFSDKLDKVYNE